MKNSVSHSCRLAWQIAKICVKGVGFPPESEFDILLLDSSSVKSNTGTNSNGMRRKSLQGMGISDIVDCRGCESKSSIDVRRPNEIRHARRKAGIREDSQWVQGTQLQIGPPLNNAKPSGHGAKRVCIEMGSGTANTNKGFLFIFVAVLLVPPSDVNGMNHPWSMQRFGKRHAASVFFEKFQVTNKESSGFPINGQLDLTEMSYMVFLSPFGKTKAGVNTADFPIVQSLIQGMGSGC
jgi:hypothetical protein